MERQPRRSRAAKPRRVTRKPPKSSVTATASADVAAPHFENIERLIAGDGDITVGSMGPIACAATAADQDICYAMLVRRHGETLLDLLQRLDRSIAEANDTGTTVDEVN